jgi:hypothetical protein
MAKQPRVEMKLGRYAATIAFMLIASPVFACSCGYVSPERGFAGAEAVFTGKVIRSSKSDWTVEVDRVWKGEVESKIELFDAHRRTSCSTRGFKKGRSYLFLVNVESKNGTIRYSPQPCNWSVALKAQKIAFEGNRMTVGEGETAKWVEEWVLLGQGEGKAPLSPKERYD